MNKLFQYIDLVKSMGPKPIAYRVLHAFKKKSGLLKKSFPTTPGNFNFISLKDWKEQKPNFFFDSKQSLEEFSLDEKSRQLLDNDVTKLKEGYLKFFNGEYILLGKNYDWLTNPQTKYKYDISIHAIELETLDEKKGDIKYVWEKSRFCYLYTIIRHDYHFKQDHSDWVISEILSWIKHNPLNMGPNYSCSQEISLRVFNWLFALYYYKNSSSLTEEKFKLIINSIHDQSRHVNEHLNFSLLTVRNNHAITECLLLYTIGLLCPFFEESTKWKKRGKKYLEQEGLYQIYKDGSYIQFSMNYERVVLQLFTWAYYLAKANNEIFSEELKKRLNQAVNYLYQCQDTISGRLPNYGSNDGALFFPLNSCDFRDYRPQLNAMNFALTTSTLFDEKCTREDLFWFSNITDSENKPSDKITSSFPSGGYYTLRDHEKFAFIRCGNHRDRPLQADNLHLDIWFNGNNIVRDAGSYKYNSSREDIKFFMGTASHNTIMLENYDQMHKGGRFLWFFWTQALQSELTENDLEITFNGTIKAFHQVSSGITHHRIVRQYKNAPKWIVEDIISGSTINAKQLWNISPEFNELGFRITSKDKRGNLIAPVQKEVAYSDTYGIKEASCQIVFENAEGYFLTEIYKQ